MIDTRSRCRIVTHEGTVITLTQLWVPEEGQTVLTTVLDPRMLSMNLVPSDEIHIVHNTDHRISPEEWNDYCSTEKVARRVDGAVAKILEYMDKLH